MKIKLDSRSSRIAVLGQRRATKAYPVMTQAITTHLTSCLRSVDSKFGTTAMNSCETFSLSSMFQGCPHVTLVEQGCPSVPQQLELNGSSLSICVGQPEHNGPQLGEQEKRQAVLLIPWTSKLTHNLRYSLKCNPNKSARTVKLGGGRHCLRRHSFSAIHGKGAEQTTHKLAHSLKLTDTKNQITLSYELPTGGTTSPWKQEVLYTHTHRYI